MEETYLNMSPVKKTKIIKKIIVRLRSLNLGTNSFLIMYAVI